MSYRQSNSSYKDACLAPQSRLNQQNRRDSTDEGCPVIEESGTVCGETNSLSIFQEFRQMYDDCLKKLEGSVNGNTTLKKLAPFKKLIDDLWEQNTMLVETVEELEQEATYRVTNLQEKLNKSCQKMGDFKDDIKCLVKIIHSFSENGVFDLTGLKFKTFCCSSVFGDCDKRCSVMGRKEERDFKRYDITFKNTELHCMLKAKEREMECLLNKLAEKEELLKKYCAQVEELKKDNKNKCKKYQELLKQLKTNDGTKICEDAGENPSNSEDLEELVNAIVKNIDDQRKLVTYQLQTAECQVKTLMAEKKMILKERNEITSQLQSLVAENEKILQELAAQKKVDSEKEELLKTIEVLKSEKNELFEKVSTLHENIQEVNNNFKETRWALTSEVAEKHDQVQELKRCVAVLEEQLRQADMQTHFKDDIIKELRKELKACRKSDRLGFYDVVNELKERRNQCTSNPKFPKLSDMNKHQSGGGFCSGTSVTEKQDKNEDKKNTNDSEKLLAQVECLKKNLKAKIEELKCQEEFTRNLEEELTKTKMDLCVLEKFQRQEPQYKRVATMTSESDLNRHHATLVCSAIKIEDIIRDLSGKHNSELSSCKVSLDREIEKIRNVKKDLERSKSKNKLSKSTEICVGKVSEDIKSIATPGVNCSDKPESQCNLVHIADVEKFREKAITGAVALEQMKEQIDILENLIKKYIEEFPCDCDKSVVGNCEEKLVKLRSEFDEVTYQLCKMLQALNKPCPEDSYYSLSCDETTNSKEEESAYTAEEVCRLKSECQRIQKEVCDQENATEKLKRTSKQIEDEIQQKRCQLVEYTRELDSKICEIFKLRELIRKVCRRLKEVQCGQTEDFDEKTNLSPGRSTSNLSGLFCDIQEFWCVLEKSMPALFDLPLQLREDNEKLKEKLGCLEKCVCNKEETLRFLQDTVRLRECQIEELKFKMETTECQSSKLAQDVEEKCRLIANLQEAVRKCKQFEVNLELLESLRFEYCDLECKLELCEKEILSKDKKLERLHNEIRDLSSKNFILTEKLKILDPKLKILYKTSHLFEKTVNELQEELNNKECEIESLYGKVRELEAELEAEFKKCEDRAVEDSKCIEELSITVKNFQNELFCAQENYNMSIMETENRLKQEMEARESQLNNTICQLRAELQELQNQTDFCQRENTSKIPDLQSVLSQAESQQQIYEKRIKDLQKALECVALEHEEERKKIMQKLCDEKKENFKNKNLITKLNESMKKKVQNEKTFKECMDRLTDEMENLKVENQELKTEVEARKKIMCAMEKEGGANLAELEELICSLKIQKAELRARCCNLKADMEKEVKIKRMLECRVEDLNGTLQSKIEKFNEMVENYKCTSSRLQQTYETMKEIEESLICSQNNIPRRSIGNDDGAECACLKKLLDIKTAENAKLICQIQVLKVEIESIQSENAATDTSKDAIISRMRSEIECLENGIDEFQTKCQKLNEENKKLLKELESWTNKGTAMQNEFRERQKDLCGKLRTTICEKNDLLNSLDELQKQLEQICLDNVNKEKINRELSEKCSRLKINKDSNDSYLKNKTEKIICNLSKEVKSLHHELSEVKENYNVLNEEYQALLDQFKCCEKKKCNLEKLYVEANNENKELLESKAKYERDLCELQTQNLILKDKLASKGEGSKNTEEKKKMCERIKELTLKIKTLEKKVIPELQQEIADKICCIESLSSELREANMSSQRMRNEALRVIEHTRKYLAAQRYANETLKTRLECSNKRGNMLGIENRELEEQLKAVTRMNEFLLCQLESGKSDLGETEPRSFSPLPWGCPIVERDTSSSEYLAESGFQSMQQSPVIMDYDRESQYDSKRNCPQWNSLKKNKCGESVEYTSYRNGLR